MSETTHSHVYPKAAAGEQSANVAPNPSFPQLETDVLDYWDKDDTFQKSIDRNPSGDHSQNEFVFFDGPPFANGMPHYGHLLTGYAKEVIPRYQTMKGRKVNRVFGWDTHGLPAELEAQKELGIESVDQIEQMGIAKFNDACRASVLKYTNEWQDYVHRQARWVDFEHGYKTLNIPYMESVMWAFKQLYDKGLAYQGYRVLPYCPKDQTPLSAHELRMDADVYQDRQDTTVSVAVKLKDEDDAYAVFWTTTPWTVPTNFAIVVGADIDYVEVKPVEGKFAGKKFYFAKALLGSYAKELGEDYEVVRELKGADMVGWRYWPVFPYFAGEDALADEAETLATRGAELRLGPGYLDDLNGILGIYELPAWIGYLLTVLATVFIINAINLIDGIDGLASGLCSIACLFYGVIFFLFEKYIYSMLAFATLGVLMPFFYYNVFGKVEHHKKIFMGDTGSLTIGMMLCFLSIRLVQCGADEGGKILNPMILAFSPLIIPCFDVVRVYLHRVRNGKNPFLPDKNHIHHKLIAIGMKQRTVMILIIAVSLLFTLGNILLSKYIEINLLLVIDIAIWTLVNIGLSRRIKKLQSNA